MIEKGLIVMDFEFETFEEKTAFEMSDFCLVDITQNKFCTGGIFNYLARAMKINTGISPVY